MQNKISYIQNWKKLFIEEQSTSASTLKPGNFYKIEVYKCEKLNYAIFYSFKEFKNNIPVIVSGT